MSYKLRFVQSFDKKDSERFLMLEQAFIQLEQENCGISPGKRFVPVAGRLPTNTLIWEAEFPTLENCTDMLKEIANNSDHDALLKEQIVYMRDAYVEIYQELTPES